jgi:hypothetical protein
MSANGQLAIGLRSPRQASWRRLVALAVAAFVVLVPVAEAFCAIDLPASGGPALNLLADAPADSPSHEHPPGRCCDDWPSALAAPDRAADDLAPASARTLDHVPALTGFPRSRSDRAVARTTARFDAPPPTQPLFRRLKRLLV